MRYQQERSDLLLMDQGYPNAKRGSNTEQERHALAEQRRLWWRATRRLRLSDIIEDVDLVIGGNVNPAMYAAAMVVIAVDGIELVSE